MRRLAWTAAAAAMFWPAAVAAQAALRVQPVAVDVAAPGLASSVTLQNNGREELSVQLRVFKWSPASGKDAVTPTTEVVASPPVARIAPGSNYTVRLARTAGPVKQGAAESYRLWIDELPPADLVRTAGGQVAVRLRLDLPVYFRGPGTAPRVTRDAQGRTGIVTGDGDDDPVVALAD